MFLLRLNHGSALQMSRNRDLGVGRGWIFLLSGFGFKRTICTGTIWRRVWNSRRISMPKKRAYCTLSHECQCREKRHGRLEWTCKNAEIQFSAAADVFISIFSILFCCCIITSIVFYICQCIHGKDYERSSNVVVIPVETFHQVGKLWITVQILHSAGLYLLNYPTLSNNHF